MSKKVPRVFKDDREKKGEIIIKDGREKKDDKEYDAKDSLSAIFKDLSVIEAECLVTFVKNIRVTDNGYIYIVDKDGRKNIGLEGDKAYLFLGIENDSNSYDPNFSGNEGDLRIRNKRGEDAFNFDGNTATLTIGAKGTESNGGSIIVRDANGIQRIKLDGGEGDILANDSNGNTLFHFDRHAAALYVGGTGNEGDVIVRDANGNQAIKLDGGQGDIILQNADCAEDFEVAANQTIEPGMVLVFDDEGILRPSTQAYDHRVAGVVAGAGSCKPGMILGRQPGAENRQPISLTGKTFCRVDADRGAIRVGDLLTTSDIPGFAMKATDPARAFGSVIGKALRPLAKGTGIIPILVALQ